jgi:hypothetical protein
MAEVRETVAPITVLEGEQQLTIEVAGEWVLQAVADGRGGQLVFGPDRDPGDKRPLLRVIDAKGRVLNEVTIEEYIGKEGLDLEVEGLVRINLGENPRAVAGDADSGPVASPVFTGAAADILRVRALNQIEDDFDELRIGHMEAAVAVPAGGLSCPGIAVQKALDGRSVQPGDRFTTTITLTNPNDCILEDVKLTDTITASAGVKWTGKGVDDGLFTVKGLGPLGPGESEEVRIDIEVDPSSVPGVFSDVAVAEGVCGRRNEVGETSGGDAAVVPVRGSAALEGPSVTPAPAADDAIPVVSPSAPPSSSPGGATPASPAGPSRKVAAAPAPKKQVPAQVAGQQTARPAVTATPATGGAPALARSGGVVGAGLAVSLLAAGAVLRMAKRRRRPDG